MSAPTYVARKVGDEYVLIRSDPSELLTRSTAVAAGAYLLFRGLRGSGFVGVASIVGGAALAYRGWTGRNPLDLLGRACVAKNGHPNDTPSFRDEGMSSGQLPEDDVDEAAMESFPASDPPALHRSAPPPQPSASNSQTA